VGFTPIQGGEALWTQQPSSAKKGEKENLTLLMLSYQCRQRKLSLEDSGVVIRAYEFSIWMLYDAVLFFFTSERGRFNKFVADERVIGIIFGFSQVREGRAELSCAVQYLAAG